MDNNLDIVDLYNSCDDNTINSFSNKLDSKLHVIRSVFVQENC